MGVWKSILRWGRRRPTPTLDDAVLSYEQMTAGGWKPYAGHPPYEGLVEYRRSWKESEPFLHRGDFGDPAFNVAGLWWRVPNIVDVTPIQMAGELPAPCHITGHGNQASPAPA